MKSLLSPVPIRLFSRMFNRQSANLSLKKQLELIRLLHLLLKQGWFIQQALPMLALNQQFNTPQFNKLMAHVGNGLSFSDGLRQVKLFNEQQILMIQAGEKTNQLIAAIRFLENDIHHQLHWRETFRRLLTYPLVMLGFVVIALGVAAYSIGPQLNAFNSSQPSDPDSLFQHLQSIPATYWSMLVGLLVALAFQLKHRIKVFVNRHITQLGLVGRIFLHADLSKLCFQLSAAQLIQLSLIDAIHLAKQVVQFESSKKFCEQWINDIYQGKPIFCTLQNSTIFPRQFFAFIQSSRGSKQQSKAWLFVAESLKQDVDQQINRIKPWIEPSIIAFCGGIVILFIVYYVLPMYQSTNQW